MLLEVAVQMNDLTTSALVDVANTWGNTVYFLPLKLILHTVLRVKQWKLGCSSEMEAGMKARLVC